MPFTNIDVLRYFSHKVRRGMWMNSNDNRNPAFNEELIKSITRLTDELEIHPHRYSVLIYDNKGNKMICLKDILSGDELPHMMYDELI